MRKARIDVRKQGDRQEVGWTTASPRQSRSTQISGGKITGYRAGNYLLYFKIVSHYCVL